MPKTDANSRRTFHHGDLHRAALEAGREKIRLDGVNKLSLRELSASIGVNHRALYRHFPDKDALVLELAGLEVRALVSVIDKCLFQTPAGEGERALMEVYVCFALDNPHLYEMIFSLPLRDEFDADTELGKAVRDFIRVFSQAFHKPGEPEPKKRNKVLRTWGAAHGLILLTFRGALRVGARVQTERYIIGTALGLNA